VLAFTGAVVGIVGGMQLAATVLSWLLADRDPVGIARQPLE
jgi:hypothetical protein